jgi:hypothetical protein
MGYFLKPREIRSLADVLVLHQTFDAEAFAFLLDWELNDEMLTNLLAQMVVCSIGSAAGVNKVTSCGFMVSSLLNKLVGLVITANRAGASAKVFYQELLRRTKKELMVEYYVRLLNMEVPAKDREAYTASFEQMSMAKRKGRFGDDLESYIQYCHRTKVKYCIGNDPLTVQEVFIGEVIHPGKYRPPDETKFPEGIPCEVAEPLIHDSLLGPHVGEEVFKKALDLPLFKHHIVACTAIAHTNILAYWVSDVTYHDWVKACEIDDAKAEKYKDIFNREDMSTWKSVYEPPPLIGADTPQVDAAKTPQPEAKASALPNEKATSSALLKKKATSSEGAPKTSKSDKKPGEAKKVKATSSKVPPTKAILSNKGTSPDSDDMSRFSEGDIGIEEEWPEITAVKKKHIEVGTTYYCPASDTINYAKNRGGMYTLQKYKTQQYGIYPLLYNTEKFTSTEKMIHNCEGLPESGRFSCWPTTAKSAAVHADFSGVPADVSNHAVSFI